jgi:hypothetical protein
VGDLFLSSLPVESFSPFFFPVRQVIRTIRKISLRPPDPPNFHRLALSCSSEASSEQGPIQSQVYLSMCPRLSPRSSIMNGHNTVLLVMVFPKQIKHLKFRRGQILKDSPSLNNHSKTIRYLRGQTLRAWVRSRLFEWMYVTTD